MQLYMKAGSVNYIGKGKMGYRGIKHEYRVPQEKKNAGR